MGARLIPLVPVEALSQATWLAIELANGGAPALLLATTASGLRLVRSAWRRTPRRPPAPHRAG